MAISIWTLQSRPSFCKSAQRPSIALLGDARSRVDGKRRRRTGVGAAIRRSIPVRTFSDWRDPPPGFLEVDMVEHCGGAKTDGNFVHSLVLTDIASGWTECIAMPVRNQSLVVEAMAMAATDLPFAMLGVDTDNDSAFMNQTVFDYRKENALGQTRSRAYKKNDQAWVEQKNGAIVRRLVGYGRLSGLAATQALAQLYSASRPVRELLPTVVQVEIQDSRWRSGKQDVSCSSHPLRATTFLAPASANR